MECHGCATAGSLEVTQQSTSCHLSHLHSIMRHEIQRGSPFNRTSNFFCLPLFCTTIWKADLAEGFLKMGSSSQSVRYRMVSNKDDLVDAEINQVEPDDQDTGLRPKSRLSELFDRQR
jgi:hypothetical protein